MNPSRFLFTSLSFWMPSAFIMAQSESFDQTKSGETVFVNEKKEILLKSNITDVNYKSYDPVLKKSSAKGTAAPSLYAFEKGNMRWDVNRYFNANYFNQYSGDQKYGHTNDIGFDIEATKFVVKNFGVGVDLSSDWSGNHYTSDNLSREFNAGVDFVYGRSLSANADIYAQIDGGYGKRKTISETGNMSVTSTDDIYSLGFKLGIPVRINEFTYFTPDFCYERCCTHFSGGRESDYRIGVGVSLETYLGCDDYYCHNRSALSNWNYQRGTSLISFSTRAGLNFGKSTTTYDISTLKQEEDHSRQQIDLYYGYYFWNNLSLGAEVGAWNRDRKMVTPVNENKFSGLSFEPLVTFNMPSTNRNLNNVFIQGGVGFGFQKTENISGSNDNVIKENTSTWCIKLGDNIPLAPNIAFTLKAGYESTTNKNTVTDLKLRSAGPDFEGGLSILLNKSMRYKF